MSLVEAEAIVLRQYPLSDSDRIIVFLTREYGKTRAVAKGVQRPQSRLGAALEPLNHLRIEYFSREGSDLHRLRQAELVRSYLGKNPDLAQVYAYSYFAELVNEIVQDNQANYPLFRLLLGAMNAGDTHAVTEALVRYFEVWCLKLSGLLPNYAYCSDCGKCVKDDGFFVRVDAGQVRCEDCARGRGMRIGAHAAAALTLMAKLPPERFAVVPLPGDAAREIERLSHRFLDLHIEKQLKSYRILKDALESA